MRTDWHILCSSVLAVALLCQPESTRAGEARHHALVAAEWALTQENTAALADSLALYLDEGGTLVPDDPFSARDLLEGLRGLSGGDALAEALLATRSRGQIGGAPRVDIVLNPGESHEIPLQLAAQEKSWIEARLWRGAAGADVDLDLRDADGTRLTADLDPQTGIEGIGAWLELLPDKCTSAILSVSNKGNAPAQVAVLIPQSRRGQCEAPG